MRLQLELFGIKIQVAFNGQNYDPLNGGAQTVTAIQGFHLMESIDRKLCNRYITEPRHRLKPGLDPGPWTLDSGLWGGGGVGGGNR